MSDFIAIPTSQAFWKLRAHPDHPVVIQRVEPSGLREVVRYPVPLTADVIPDAQALGVGLYLVTTGYEDANHNWRELVRTYLVYGPFSILSIDDALSGAIRAVISKT